MHTLRRLNSKWQLVLAALVAAGCLTAQNTDSLRTKALSGAMPLRSAVIVQPGLEKYSEAVPSILDRTTAEYVFGRVVSRQALAVQITIKNTSSDHDLLVSQISLYFCEQGQIQTPAPPQSPSPGSSPGTPLKTGAMLAECGEPLSLSSMDKIVLQGLADRGQSIDPRNVILRLIEGVGAIAVPFPTFIHHIGGSFTPAVAAWNGPFVDAYKTVFPDYTVNQIIRLSNMAFSTNKVVPKGSSETVMAFIPLDILLDKTNRKLFDTDPHRLFADLGQRSMVRVDANFIAPVQPVSAGVTSVLFDLAAQRAEVKGTGFDQNSKVLLNGKALPTAFWNGELWGMLDPSTPIKNGDTASITVQQADGTVTKACAITVSPTEQTCPAPSDK